MVRKKISHYKILEEIGSGGMGVVYKAEDLKLKRTVALKFVVPRMIRKKEDKERFLREAQTAASLNHPHICTIFHIDEVEDSTFIVMEYIEGQSLKELVRKGPLELEKALNFAIQIADGLEEAEGKNIIHRDIKSSNIMVNKKAQAKIMDFGLAKVISESHLTETASIMGTVAYMSPEHASGDAIDHRSDIWSLGVVLYEMLTGELPFQGDHEQLVLYSILNKYHRPLSDLRPTIPGAMERIVDKCLEKDPAERYQHANELLEDLRWLKKETESGVVPRTKPTWKRRRTKKLRKLVVPGVLMFFAVVVISGYFLLDWFKPKISIAVLPIKDGSPLKENDLLCMSTTRQIIFKLTKFSPNLKVVPYDSVRNYKDSEKDSIQIGKEFDAEYVLVASLFSEGDKIQINVELIDVKTNRNILVIPEDFGGGKIFDVEDEISKRVVDQLGLHFKKSGMAAAKKRQPDNVEAFLASIGLFPSANKYYNKAIQIEPSYLRAYELSSYCHWYMGEFEEGIEKITKVIEMVKNSPGLHFQQARNLIMIEEYEKAEQEMAMVMSIQPEFPELAYLQALLFAARGEKEKALQLIEGVEKPYQYCITSTYSLLGMTDEAIRNIQLGIDVGFEEEQHYLYSYLLLENNPSFDNLRDDPRFLKILKKRKEVHGQRLSITRNLL